jgi:cysteine desulfurase
MIYLDNAGTTKPLLEVIKAMQPYFSEYYGNPQSFHDVGEKPAEAVEEARGKVAGMLGADKPEEITVVSSGTEANNFSLNGVAYANQKKGKHIITSAIEHFSVLYSAQFLERMGWEVTYLPVDKYGLVDPADVEKAIRDDTVLVSINHSNNEIGTIEPIKEIGKITREKGVPLHTDAVASAGHVPLDVNDLGVDLLSISGHRFYGPKGTGALYIREGTRIHPITHGGIQENGRRAGTENVSGIVGIGKAAEITKKEVTKREKSIRVLRDELVEGLSKSIDHMLVNGHPEKVLPTHVSVCVEFIEGEGILALLNEEGVAAASGSACTSKALKASHVITALGIDHATAQGTMLFTLGIYNKKEDIDKTLKTLPPIVQRLRTMSPLWRERFGNKETV